MKTSIKYKRLLISLPGADGGMGTNFVNYVDSAREGTAQIQGSSADSTSHKNVAGEVLEVTRLKGDKTVAWQCADLTPEAIALLTDGRVNNQEDYVGWQPPADENVSIYLSVEILSANNIVYRMPRVSIDAFPVLNDDDLHYFSVEGTVVKPEKAGIPSLEYMVLSPVGVAKNAMKSFQIGEAVGVINESTKSIAVTVPSSAVVSDLVPVFSTDLGSFAAGSGSSTDFTNPVEYPVVAANGDIATYTVTVTKA